MSIGNAKALLIVIALLAASAQAEPLRTVQDAAHNRTWVLERDAVYMREAARIKRFDLPGWMYIGEAYSCSPDIAIDGEGAAVVTSNAAPIVWRIEPATSQVTMHELVLDADEGEEIGFTGLAYAPDQGVFFAVSATYGSLWRIDPLLRRAQKIPVSEPLRHACGLSVEHAKARRIVVLCIHAMAQSRRVRLAPDQRFAYARHESCPEHGADDVALTK